MAQRGKRDCQFPQIGGGAMSFASEVREELCRELPERRCCRLAECYGILLYCNTFRKQEIRIVTENLPFAQRLPKLFRRTFGLEFDQDPDLEQPGKHTFVINTPEKLETIFSAFGQEHDALALHINFGVLENDCCRQSFIRGAFLAGGSVTDPDKRYHLELITSHRKVSAGTRSLLQELGFEPKDTQRAGSSVLYLKQSDMIVDFLTMIGAQLQAMKIIQEKESSRASYYSYYTGKKWGNAASYDLCINTSVLGIKSTTELIEAFIKKRYNV